MARTTFERDKDLKRTILIVDDESINREILGFIVSHEYDVLYAENGKEALNLIHNDSFSISLILLDLLMPEMDGYEVLKILSKEDRYNHIPVIVLTSEKQAEVKSLELGAVDFITKPYDTPEVIMARISRSIELAESMQIIQATERDYLTGLFTRDY
ncbi:MAG: response regulator, partial [Lachnospiraceae bacterium]|nr:response regulator [Lachnospiraceae bacterium]